jgi:hypothetical protein
MTPAHTASPHYHFLKHMINSFSCKHRLFPDSLHLSYDVGFIPYCLTSQPSTTHNKIVKHLHNVVQLHHGLKNSWQFLHQHYTSLCSCSHSKTQCPDMLFTNSIQKNLCSTLLKYNRIPCLGKMTRLA